MRAYGMELRKRAWAALEEGATSEEVGERMGIDPSCVRKWRKRVREGGTLVPGGERTGRKREFDGRYERELGEAVREVPDAIRRELSELVGKRLGRVFSEPVIGRALKRLGMSRKKNSSRQRAAATGRAGGTRAVGQRRRAR